MLISGVSNLLHPSSTAAPIQPPALQPLFAQLEQTALQPSSASTAQSAFLAPPSGSPIAQLLAQFSQTSSTGNAPAPQQDYAAPQTVPSQATQTHAHHHHHGGGGNNALSQLFEQLGQDLQTGNLAEAQQAYGALVSDLPQSGSTFASAAQSGESGVSVTA